MTQVTDDKMPVERIDRSAYEPAYVQLANILRRQIARGQFRPGDQLPSEAQLCRLYGVSPMTVRRSINLLADDDVISTAQGRGTFVKPVDLGTAAFHLYELQELFSNPDATRIKLLDVRILPASSRVARKLDLSLGDKCIYIRRLLLIGDEPAFYHREYLIYDPTRPIVEAEMEVTDLQGLFSEADSQVLKRGSLSIEAALLTAEEAEVLRAERPSAAFVLEHVFYDFDDRPVSWGWFVCRGEWLKFSTTVGIIG